MDLIARRRALMTKIIALVKTVITSATGLVSFVTDIVRPVKVTCEFYPVQEGTGDPSPDNVRPISGWTGVNIYHGKNNVLPDNIEIVEGGFFQDGRYRVISSLRRINRFQFPYSNCTFTISFDQPSGKSSLVRVLPYDANENYIGPNSDFWISSPQTFTLPENTAYLAIGFDTGITDGDVTNLQIQPGSVELDYEAPSAVTTLPINWQSEAGTIYGGTVTLNADGSGDLLVNRAKVVFDGSSDEVWLNNGNLGVYTAADRIPGISSEASSPIYSNQYSQVPNGSAPLINGKFNWNVVKTALQFRNDNALDVKSFRASLASNPLEICYVINNPVHYPLTAKQITAFLGENNIWHDMNGDITVEY